MGMGWWMDAGSVGTGHDRPFINPRIDTGQPPYTNTRAAPGEEGGEGRWWGRGGDAHAFIIASESCDGCEIEEGGMGGGLCVLRVFFLLSTPCKAGRSREGLGLVNAGLGICSSPAPVTRIARIKFAQGQEDGQNHR